MKNKDYNEYDNPSSQMRVNMKLLKHVMIVNDWVIKNETPILVKASAKEVMKRTDKYCSSNYRKVYDEVPELIKNTIERFYKDEPKN